MTDTIPDEVIEAMLRKWYDPKYAKNPRMVIEPNDMRDMRAALSAADKAGYVLVPKKPTEAMMLAGRKPIMARDCLNGDGHWTLGDHMREGGHKGWASGGELARKTLSKGDCAVMTFRAMLSAAPKVM